MQPAVDDLLARGDLYGAQQKARTSASRLLGIKGAAAARRKDVGALAMDDKAREALELLSATALRLVRAGEPGGAADLAVFMADILRSRGVRAGPEERAHFTRLLSVVGSEGAWRKTISDAVFHWTAATGSGPAGDPDTHRFLGELFLKERNLPEATTHLILSPSQDAALALAEAQYEWLKVDSEGRNGAGRYAARVTLAYLEHRAVLAAKTFLSRFVHLLSLDTPGFVVERIPYPTPGSSLAQSKPDRDALGPDELVVTRLASINFLQLAVRAVQAGEGDWISDSHHSLSATPPGRSEWLALLAHYDTVKWFSLPSVKQSFATLGQLYFGIQPARPVGNPMMDMLGSLFGGAPAGAR